MDFEIRHESAAILKPVIDAAARTLNNAQIELGPGGMRIWGNSPDSVAGIDMTVPAEAFDTYDVDEGAFQTNIDAWQSAIRGTRKTDPVAVYTKSHDYERWTNVPHIGTDERRVLKSLGYEGPSDLKGVPAEELVGETDYKSANETKTAEIDAETAEAIAFAIKSASYVVIESDGEDQIDGRNASKYPQIRYPSVDYQVPDRDVAATASVNGRDFSKAYRAVADVTDVAFIGATEGTLLLYGEGDTDTVHASPESDVEGSEAAGLYSAEWLSTLRLSLDRKASTELRFGIPRASREDETDKHILWADFAIEKNGVGADVSWFVAPRVLGANADDEDEEPESEAERLGRIAPSNYSPTSGRWTVLDATTTGGMAKSWFSTLTAKNDEARFHLGEDGISARFVDPANVMMQDVQLGAEAWDSYSFRGHDDRLERQDGQIGVNMRRVMDYLKLFTKTEAVEIQVDKVGKLVVNGPNFTATMPTIDPDSVRTEPDLPGLDLPGSAEVDAESLTDAVDDCADVADHVGIIIYDGTCYAYADGDLDTVWREVDTYNGEGYASSLYSEDYLGDYLGSIPSGQTETIRLVLGREFPMFAEHSVGHVDADFTMMLAPRIQDDGGDVFGSDAIKEHGMDPLRIKEAEPAFTIGDDNDVVRKDNPGEDLPSNPSEAAERVRENTVETEDDDPYDPTEEFTEYGPTSDTNIPTPERVAGLEGTGLAPSDLEITPGKRGENFKHLDDDEFIHRDDAEKPEIREKEAEDLRGIYDPSQDMDGDTDTFRASQHHRTAVPEQIGDWRLKVQVQEGRPVYVHDGQQLRINRSHSTDVVHRRYNVTLLHDEELAGGVSKRETLESGLSPEEAMDALEREARKRSTDEGQGAVEDDDAEAGVYDPTDEFEEMEEPSEISPIGEGRRKTLDALDAKDRLDDPQTFNSLEEMTEAVREISLAHRDGRTYMAPPEDAIDAIERVYNGLPNSEARQEFLNDHRLYVKIRAARNRFNDWMGKQRRRDEIPSTMEAGPSNYPSKKANDTARYAREANEELKEAIGKIRSAANGARQRALQAIGSSVAEQNEQEAQEKRDKRREEFQKGDLAFYSTTTYGNALWGVKRVNDKSVTLRRPHGSAGMEVPMSDGDTYPEFDTTRADLDSSRLKGPVPAEEVAAFSVEDTDARTSDDSIAVRADTADEARRLVFGEEWAAKNQILDGTEGRPAEDQLWLSEVKGIGQSTEDDLSALGLSNLGDAKDAYRDRAQSDTWQKALNTLPSSMARENLIERVGGDPEATVAEDQREAYEQKAADHMGAPRLEGAPSVGNYLGLEYTDGGGMNGTVTRVEDGEALIRVAEGQAADTFDYQNDTLTTAKGKKHDVWRAEVIEEDAEVYDAPDTPTGGYDVPGEEDLSDAIHAKGVNRITANHLADEADSLGAVEEAVRAADDVTDLKGVGDGSKAQVLAAFGADGDTTQAASDSSESESQVSPTAVPDAVAEADTLPGGFEFQGESDDPYLKGDSPEPAGPFYYWKRDSGSMAGVYENAEYADDGYPFTAAKWVNPKGDNPYWKHTHIAESWADAVDAARRNADQRTFIVESEAGENYEEWESRTGGTDYEHPVTPPWEEADEEDDTATSTLATDPETGETDRFDVPEGINGWERQDDAPKTRGLAVWTNPNAEEPVDYLHVTKTGPDAYLVQRNTGEKGDYDRENHTTVGSAEKAISGAEDYMATHPVSSEGDDRDDEHREAVEAARDADPDGDLPGPALKALKKNWGVYKRGISEGKEAVEEAKEYRDEHRGDAERAAAIINDIRDAYGQEPIDFEGVDGVPAVDELGGPITEESSGVSLSFDWKADPYDPTEDV